MRGRDEPPEAGAPRSRFGEELLVLAGGSHEETTKGWLLSKGSAAKELQRGVREDELWIVVQTGRSFRSNTAGAKIVFDRGRYLAVWIPHGRAGNVPRETSDWIRYPLFDHPDAFDVSKASGVTITSPRIGSMVASIDPRRYRAHVEALVGLGTRFSTHPRYLDAVTYCHRVFSRIRLNPQTQQFTINGLPSWNLVADLRGNGANRRTYLLTAHLDSKAPPDHRNAPGADDNASGSAGVLEIAEVLAANSHYHDLRFVLFGGEEYPPRSGSRYYVGALTPDERRGVKMVVNMDMIACSNGQSGFGVTLEGSYRDLRAEFAAAASYVPGLEVWGANVSGVSDHLSFEGVCPAFLTIEGTRGIYQTNRRIHTSQDTLASLNFELASRILKLNTAFLASKAEVE